MIFNYVRTPSQIAWDLNKGKPVAQWKLNDCTGTTANDSSGNNIVGTITIGASGTNTAVGTCTTSGAWFDGATGKFNGSIELDGTDDSISMGDPASEILDMGTSNFSVSAWIKTTASGSMRIINKRNSSNVGYELYLETGQNTLGMLIGDAGGFTFGDSGGTENLRDGNWHHVAVTFNRSAAASYYVDGRLTGTPRTISTRSGTISNSQTFYLGRLGTAASSFFNGQIDEVNIYNYLLTDAQIKNIYNNSSAIRFSP